MASTCVSKKDFSETLEYLFQEKEISLDCEATGLNVWTGDQLFSIAISDRIYTHYFNFKSYPNLDSEYVLGEAHLKRFKEFFENYRGTVYMFNAKFDLALLLESGIEIETKVVDVMVLARILRNNNLKYSLDECAKRQGMKKDDAVEKYISANHLWEWEDVPGKKGRFKKMFFDRVPLEIMVPYAKTDAKITFKLGVLYTDEILKISSETPDSLPMMKTLLENEIRLTKTCFAMEKIGIKINKSYCEEKLRECEQVISNTLAEIKNITKVDFVDSNKNLKKLFEDLGVKTYEVTDLGNPSFTDTSLRKTKHPLAELILKYREAYKLANTYYRGFLYHADINDVLHTNMKQSGTETGRFSYANPNLQNVPTESDIRKCFIARDNYSFVEMDYKAFEYRMLCEYAQETELAKRIMNGEDIHTVTAQMVGVERHVAKSLNFACLYGAGPGRISEMLGISIDEARKFRQKYFQALPKIESFIRTCSDVAKQRGFIFNWLGRRSYIDSDFSYKATNSLIQGSCADIVKVAMNQCADYLKYSKSRMLIQVHDSILFEIHDDEKRVVPKLKEIMENAYQGKNIKMEVDVSDFGKNWAEIS